MIDPEMEELEEEEEGESEASSSEAAIAARRKGLPEGERGGGLSPPFSPSESGVGFDFEREQAEGEEKGSSTPRCGLLVVKA